MEHIAFYLSNMEVGGAQRVVANLANEFDQRGFEIDVVLVAEVGPLLENLRSGIEVVDLNSSRAVKSLPHLVQYLRNNEPDALFSSLTYLNDVALLASLVPSISTHTLVSEHNIKDQSQLDSKEVRIAKYLYPRANHIVAVSKGVADDIVTWSRVARKEIEVVYNPVFSENLVKQAETRPNHRWYQDNNSSIVVSAGRFIKEKDFETLIRAFNIVVKETNAKLVILGDGPNRSDLESLVTELGIGNSVDFIGFVDPPYAYMNYADLFVLSSRSEGLGNVLIEAMSVGTPVVSTNCPTGPSEVLEQGQYGSLVTVGSHEALSEAILESLDNHLDPSVLKNRAKEFSVESIADEYENLIFSQLHK
jgi:glycosyltransferase involved in cell wall biosynthesis